MRLLDKARLRLRSLWRRSSIERELDAELRFHLDQLTEEKIVAGQAPEEARRQALLQIGRMTQFQEECRDTRRTKVVEDLLRDLRYAGRSLRRSPGFAALAVGIMALGIGANTAVFSVVNAVLLKPLPYPGAHRIVTLSTVFLTSGNTQGLVSIGNFRDWHDQSSSFEAMATYRGGEYPVAPGVAAEYARLASIGAEFFRVFAVEPVLGRAFTDEEMEPESRAALISYTYWQNRLGGDPGVLGRTIRIGTDPWPIVGVLPARFQFPRGVDIWIPERTRSTSRTSHNLYAVGRLKPDVSLEHARAELTAIATRLEQQYPESNKGRGVAATRLQDELVGDVRRTLYLLWGVVAVVLLIACANTATLLLGKAAARTREIAVRASLGASRRAIIRHLITESLLLALLAGALGVLLAYWGAEVLVALAPSGVVRLADTGIDAGVLAFTLAVTLATSLLFGLVPALHASKVDLIDALKQGGARSVLGGGTFRTRGVFVVSEIALAVMLLTAAGLLMKSLMALHRVELGFQPENVLVMKATGVRSQQENNAYFRDVLDRVAALPGVVAAGATSTPPGDLANFGSGSYFIDRMPEQRDRTSEPQALFSVVAPGAFDALGIPLRSGRDFSESDTAGRPLVAVVNEALVRKAFGGENPIGRTIFCTFDRKEGMTIIGVVGDVRQRNPALEPMAECYMPYTQHEYNNNTLNVVMRTVADPPALAGTVRRLSGEISPDVPVSFTTMETTVSKGLEDSRFRTLLFAFFAALAVCLAMAGVYGVMAHAVEQRSKEIGLRMALGASTNSVSRLVLKQAMTLASLGLILGLAGAVAASRLLTAVLFEVRPGDPWVYLAVAMLLAAVTLVAGYLPARRAARIDPLASLRQE